MRKDRPSQTAIGVARGLVWASNYSPVDEILPKGAASLTRKLIEAAGWIYRWELRQVDRWIFKAGVRLREERGPLRGGIKHIALRKRYFDDRVVAGVEDGATQVVVLGAGLDTVAVRNSEHYPDVSFLEVDHPATQRVKREGLAHAGVDQDNLHLVPLDLSRKTLRETLVEHPAFRPGQPTVFVAEGLLMYLKESEVTEVFDLVAELGGEGSRIVYSFIETDDAGTYRMGRGGWLLRPMLAVAGEPFQWGSPRAEFETFLQARGLKEIEQFDDNDLLGEYIPEHLGAVCLGWEYVGVAGK